MPVPIAVELAPGYWSDPPCAAILTEACSRAAGTASGDGCALVDPGFVGSARAVAVVLFDRESPRRVRINVVLPNGQDAELRTRELMFRDEDPAEERCRATGLVIASLASAQPTTTAPTTHQVTASRLGLETVAFAGQGMQGGPLRAGAFVLAAYSARNAPWFGSVSASYAHVLHEPAPGLSVGWATLGCGGGVSVPLAAMHAAVRLRLEGFLEITTASYREGGASAASQSWGPGTRAALEVLWPAEGSIAAVAGFEALVRAHPVIIRREGAPVGTSPAGGYAGFVGVQFHFGG